MTEYNNNMTFTLFRNNRKENEKHADFNGVYTDENGIEYYLNAWSKTSKKSGEKFLSGTVKRKTPERASAPAPQKRVELDDDVPFAPEFR